MKQLKLLGTAFIAIIALTSIAASLAQAAATLPSILPEGTEAAPLKGNSTSGTSTFGSGALEVVSKKSKGSFALNNFKLGTFKVDFEEVENPLLGAKCKGLSASEPTGLVLVEGSFHVVDYDPTPGLRTAATFLLTPVHFECGTTLVLVSGCVAGRLTPENALTKFLTVTLTKLSNKFNEVVTILQEGSPVLCQLLANVSGMGFVLSSEATTQTLKEGEKGTEKELAVLVMPL